MFLRLSASSVALAASLMFAAQSWSQDTETTAPVSDEIYLKNGDKVTGKILSLAGGTLKVETSYAGTLEIAWSEVASFNAPGALDLVLEDGAELSSKARRGIDGQVQVDGSGLAAEQLALSSIEKINPDPIAWTGNIAAGMQFKRGNSDENSATVTGVASRRSDWDRISLNARYTSTRTKDATTRDWSTTDNYLGAFAQYDYFVAEDWFVYANAGAERDRAKFLEARYTGGLGVGWQFAEEEDLTGSLEGGLNWISEKYKLYQNHPVPPGSTPPTISSNEDYVAARVGFNLDWKLHEELRYVQFTQYFPSLEDADKYLIKSSHMFRLSVTGNLFVQAGVIYDFDSQPGSSGAEKLDAKYLVQLGWSF